MTEGEVSPPEDGLSGSHEKNHADMKEKIIRQLIRISSLEPDHDKAVDILNQIDKVKEMKPEELEVLVNDWEG